MQNDVFEHCIMPDKNIAFNKLVSIKILRSKSASLRWFTFEVTLSELVVLKCIGYALETFRLIS